MTIDSLSEALAALRRDPNELLGVAETIWLEFKGEPYQLTEDAAKLELAKDITAMTANGGVIVIGVRTKQDSATQQDVAETLRPIPTGLINVRQLTDVVHAWVFPRLDIDAASYPVPGATGEIWSIISFPKADDVPYLVKGELTPQGRATRNFFGVFERTPTATNVSYSAEQIHGWIQRGRFPGIASTPATTTPAPDASLEERKKEADTILADDVAALELPPEAIYYYIQAMPLEARRLSNFYEGADKPMMESIQRQSPIRESGFRLPAYTSPERTASGYRMVNTRGVSFSVTSSGITTLVVGQAVLTWAMHRFTEGKTSVNVVALTELTTEFWRFLASQVVTRVGLPVPPIGWRAGIAPTRKGSDFLLYLPKVYRRDSWYSDSDLASAGGPIETNWRSTSETDSGRLAFITLKDVYERFGLDSALILARADETISEEAIRAIG